MIYVYVYIYIEREREGEREREREREEREREKAFFTHIPSASHPHRSSEVGKEVEKRKRQNEGGRKIQR